MEQVELGKSGLRVSRIGTGMWQAGGKNPWGDDVNDEDSIAAMVRAHELGVNLFDTAEGYGAGHSEEVVGRAVREIGRDEVVIATKVSGNHLRYDDVQRACDRSLKRLGVDAIDLYQVHWPDPWQQVPLTETMHGLERLYADGKIRAIAVSNFAIRDLEEARTALSKTDIASNQVQYSLLQREIEKEVLPYCQKEDLSVLAWSPLAKGVLTGKYDRDHKPEDPLRTDHVLFRDKNLASAGELLRILKEVGEAHGRTVPQVALSWHLFHDGVIPIPGAKRPEHVESNVGAVGWDLSEREFERIDEASFAIKIDQF